MKRHIVTVSLLGTMLGVGVINTQAAPLSNHPENTAPAPKGDVPPPDTMGPPPTADFQHEKNFLHLNAEQEKNIAGILAEERKKIPPLLKKLDDLRLQLHQAEFAPELKDADLQSLAERLSKTETELIIAHAKMNRRVMAVLTEDQRQLLQKQPLKNEFPHGPPSRPERTTGSNMRH